MSSALQSSVMTMVAEPVSVSLNAVFRLVQLSWPPSKAKVFLAPSVARVRAKQTTKIFFFIFTSY